VISVNAEKIHIRLFRVNERSLSAILENRFLKQIEGYNIDELAVKHGREIWKGVLQTRPRLNQEVTTAFPIRKILPRVEPGVYVMIAEVSQRHDEEWKAKATQWFVISDMGLTTLETGDGLHVFVRSLASAREKGGEDAIMLLNLIQNALRGGNEKHAEEIWQQAIMRFPLPSILSKLQPGSERYKTVPLDLGLLDSFIKRHVGTLTTLVHDEETRNRIYQVSIGTDAKS